MNLKTITRLSVFLFVLSAFFVFGGNVYADTQYSGNIIPAMTSNTSPSGIASASSIYSSGYDAWKVFDGKYYDQGYTDWDNINGLPQWIAYEFPEAHTIGQYSIKAINWGVSNGTDCAKDWRFEGTNNGTDWTILDTRSGVVFGCGEKKTFTISNPASFKKYRVYITAIGSGGNEVRIDGIEMMEVVSPSIQAPANLTAAPGNAQVDLSWDAVTCATGYNVKRSTTAGGSYTTVANNVYSSTFSDSTVTNGTTYYYVVTAVSSSSESANSNEVSAIPQAPTVTLSVDAVDKAKVGDEITANIVIHNATNICAEDIKIVYDTNLLEFVSSVNADGMKIYKEADLSNGTRRYITASLGKANAANGDKILLSLKFKAKAVGQAKIDIVNGRIADNATLEMDVTQENCGEKAVTIEGFKDVNRSGEFTLLDLGIDAWYYGDPATSTDSTKYDADVITNGTIDEEDLNTIVTQMLSNTNYPANN